MRYNLKLQRPNKTLSPVQFVSPEAEKRFSDVLLKWFSANQQMEGTKSIGGQGWIGHFTKHPEVLLLSADLREAGTHDH